MKKLAIVIPFLLCSFFSAFAQNYHAIHGSSYAGSLGVANNPASIINNKYSWDLTLFSLQETTTTNIVTILNYSLLRSPAKSQYRVNNGEYERKGRGNFNLHLLNARIALNRKSAIAFGMNARGYLDVNTSSYNFIDTAKNLRDILKINDRNTNLNGKMTSSNWLEIFGTYSRTLQDDEQGRLNAGITVKATSSIAGAFAELSRGSFSRTMQNNRPVYYVNAGSIRYGYSATLDEWKKGRSNSDNVSNVMADARGGVSFDLGFEYIIKPQAVTAFNDEDNYYDYEWKIAVSLLDVGVSRYTYSGQSRHADDPKVNLSDISLQNKFTNVTNVTSFNDSLGTVFADTRTISGNFTILNPARLVINVDRYLEGNFYVNGEISANLSSLAAADKLYSAELNFLTVTPRWETKNLGFYLPIQLNAERRFWVGGALKAGPLLFGVHNLSNIFAKNKFQNGGGYLAVVVRPGFLTKGYRDKRYDCPK